jgi:hypothetical protein
VGDEARDVLAAVDDGAGADLRDELDVVVKKLRKLVERAAAHGAEPATGELLA